MSQTDDAHFPFRFISPVLVESRLNCEMSWNVTQDEISVDSL